MILKRTKKKENKTYFVSAFKTKKIYNKRGYYSRLNKHYIKQKVIIL